MVRNPDFFQSTGARTSFTLGHGHREKFTLLARDEYAIDAKVVLPVRQISGKALLVDFEVLRERRERRCPYAFHVFTRTGLRIFCAISSLSFLSSSPQIPFCMAFQIFSLVSGISRCVTPKPFSALTAAFTIAAGTPTQPASPTPLAPR